MDWIVTPTPEAVDDPVAALASPPEGATIVELRLDLFPGLDVAAAVASCPLPILATLRSAAEGGRGPEEAEQRVERLRAARDGGAALLDLEHDRDSDLMRTLGLGPEQVVLSWHDPNGTPEDLNRVAQSMLESPARWAKVIPSVTSLADLMTVLDLQRRFNGVPKPRRRLLAFGMGTEGLASRYLAPLLGPPIGYAAWDSSAPAAPGQLSIAQVEAVIGHLDGPPQRLYGVVGADVSRSLSPALHGAGYRALGLPYVLVPISVPDPVELAGLFTPQKTTAFDRIGLQARGWAVTTPYKAEAAAAADHHAPRVLRAAAANTLILGTQQVMAENTDADGIVGSLVAQGLNPQGQTAVVQGTGGAARGAAVGLHLAGAEVYLRSRSEEKAEETAEMIEVDWCEPTELPSGTTILVNATPLAEQSPFTDDEIANAKAVVDMVYASRVTDLVTKARNHDLVVADGREVLLHQGIAQFAAFTQMVPPKEAMRAALSDSES